MSNKSNTNQNPAQFIETFFNQQGLQQPKKPEFFWKQLEKRFGRLAKEFVDCVEARERGESANPYTLKNSDPQFANAILSQFDRTKLKTIGVWLINEHLSDPPTRILEIGCDNGLLACLLATIFPNSEIVGIDVCEVAIDRAKERAESVGATNLSFECMDVADASSLGQFDLVLSVAVFHEILKDPRDESDCSDGYSSSLEFSFKDYESNLVLCDEVPLALSAIQECMAEDGHFVSVDRWANPKKLLRWIREVERSGLSVSLHNSFLIEYKDIQAGGKETLPLTYFTKSDHSPPNVNEILSFFGYNRFEALDQLNNIEDPVLAEMVHAALEPYDAVWKMTSEYYDGGGTEIATLGFKHTLGFLYRSTNMNYRSIHIFPVAVMSEKVDAWRELESDRSHVADVEVEFSEDQDLLKRLGIV